MAMNERPEVIKLTEGGKYWEHEFEKFYLKAYYPESNIDGQILNYTFRAPLIVIFEEQKMTMENAVEFAESTGLAAIAKKYDSMVLFVYPTNENGWDGADISLYTTFIEQVKNDPRFEDGICKIDDFFTKEFKGYFIRGALFRADIYSFGKSADYVAGKILSQESVQGEALWGPGDITPAMCSVERLSITPIINNKKTAVISIGNNDEINNAFKDRPNLLVKDKADYCSDYRSFVCKFKMWCGELQTEPDLDELGMIEESGICTVNTSRDNNEKYKGSATHPVGYFAYYNKGLMDNEPVPLMIGFHGGGDSSMYLTFVSGWYEVARKNNFLFVSVENHQFITATEVVEVINHLKQKYNVDENRIYATGFSMGSGKTWDLFQEYPEILAGVCPASALFPVKDNFLGQSHGDNFNTDKPLPVFYSAGEQSPVPEMPGLHESTIERLQYLADVNKLNVKFDISFEEKESWENPFWGYNGDRLEKEVNEENGSVLTVQYYTSTDGVCRTALSSISGQGHECRRHTCEKAWDFISKFKRV